MQLPHKQSRMTNPPDPRRCGYCGGRMEVIHETGYAYGHDHRQQLLCPHCGYSDEYYDNSQCDCDQSH